MHSRDVLQVSQLPLHQQQQQPQQNLTDDPTGISQPSSEIMRENSGTPNFGMTVSCTL